MYTFKRYTSIFISIFKTIPVWFLVFFSLNSAYSASIKNKIQTDIKNSKSKNLVIKYQVKKGDTLTTIAQKNIGSPVYTKDGSLSKLLILNKEFTKDDYIFPGEIVDLPLSEYQTLPTLRKPASTEPFEAHPEQNPIEKTATKDPEKKPETELTATTAPAPTSTQVPAPAPAPVSSPHPTAATAAKPNSVPAMAPLTTAAPITEPVHSKNIKNILHTEFHSNWITKISSGFFRFDSVDTTNNATSVIASDLIYNFNLEYQYSYTNAWKTLAGFEIGADRFLNKSSTNKTIVIDPGFRKAAYTGISINSFNQFETIFNIGIKERYFFYSTNDGSVVNAERIAIPNLKLIENVLLYQNINLRIGSIIQLSYLMSSSGTNYSILNGNQFGLGLSAKKSLKKLDISAELLVEQNKQDTSVQTQKETSVFLGLSAHWGAH